MHSTKAWALEILCLGECDYFLMCQKFLKRSIVLTLSYSQMYPFVHSLVLLLSLIKSIMNYVCKTSWIKLLMLCLIPGYSVNFLIGGRLWQSQPFRSGQEIIFPFSKKIWRSAQLYCWPSLPEKDVMACGLLKNIRGSKFIATLYVLNSILPHLAYLSLAFQNFGHIKPVLQCTKDALKDLKTGQMLQTLEQI